MNRLGHEIGDDAMRANRRRGAITDDGDLHTGERPRVRELGEEGLDGIRRREHDPVELRDPPNRLAECRHRRRRAPRSRSSAARIGTAPRRISACANSAACASAGSRPLSSQRAVAAHMTLKFKPCDLANDERHRTSNLELFELLERCSPRALLGRGAGLDDEDRRI
jgi:hypothetical protein